MSNVIHFDPESRINVLANQSFWSAYGLTRSGKEPNVYSTNPSQFDVVHFYFWWFVPTDIGRDKNPDIVWWIPGYHTRSEHTYRDWRGLLLTLDEMGCKIWGTVYMRDEYDWFKKRFKVNVQEELERYKKLLREQI